MTKPEVHTIQFGKPAWLAECAPTLTKWCQRYNYSLFKWDDSHGLPTPKLVVKKMLKKFLDGDSEQFIYVDADVFVRPDAPAFPTAAGIALATDPWHQMHNEHFRNWAQENCDLTAPPTWQYRNAGVWTVNRAGAKSLLAAMNRIKFVEFFQEQHWFNACVIASKTPVVDLSSLWNRYGKDYEPSWFFHLWGNSKLEDLAYLRTTGLLTALPKPPVPSPVEGGPAVLDEFQRQDFP